MNNLSRFIAARPLPVTIVSIFVLCITAWNGIRAAEAIVNWNLLLRFDGDPVYILATGLFWFIAGLILLASIPAGTAFAWRAALALSVLYMFWYWLDRLAIQASPAGNWMFSAAVSITIFVLFSVFLFWPSSRAFFRRRTHE